MMKLELLCLAVLDCVCRDNAVAQSSVVVVCLSVRPSSPSVRLWHRLFLKLLHGFLINFNYFFP